MQDKAFSLLGVKAQVLAAAFNRWSSDEGTPATSGSGEALRQQHKELRERLR